MIQQIKASDNKSPILFDFILRTHIKVEGGKSPESYPLSLLRHSLVHTFSTMLYIKHANNKQSKTFLKPFYTKIYFLFFHKIRKQYFSYSCQC